MDMSTLFGAIGSAIGSLLSPVALGLLAAGVLLGLVMGVIPGMGVMTTLVLVLPFTFGWDPFEAFVLLCAVLGSTTVGGSVSAILINVPGTGENICTTLDGYPMTKQGRAAEALTIASLSSLSGSVAGVLILIALIPVMSAMALACGPAEVFWLGVFALVILATATGGSFTFNLLVGGLAFALCVIGLSPAVASPRFAHGITYLWGGIPLIPALVGAFAIPELARLIGAQERISAGKIEVKGSKRAGLHSLVTNKFCWLRATITGFIIGAIPGVGGAVANYVAYAQAAQTAKNSKFGQGDPRGIIAGESANNAKDVGQFVPTLSLGIPGSGTMVIFLGALELHGICPGPSLMREHLDLVWLIIIAASFAFCLACLVVLFASQHMAHILRANIHVLSILILAVCFVAIYFFRNEPFDLLTMVVFGVMGYVVDWLKGSRVLLILPIILGPIIEHNLLVGIQVAMGDISYFFSPISITLILMTLFSVVFPLVRGHSENKVG